MLFPDRLEIMNPGKLPVGLTIEDLYSAHKSIPANPLIADAFYLNGTIEKAGTGTGDIVAYCTKMGLKKPTFKQGSGFDVILYRKTYEDQPTDLPTNQVTLQPTTQVTTQPTTQPTTQVKRLLTILEGDMDIPVIMESLGLTSRKTVRINYVKSALELDLIEPLYPETPNHPQQKYRLTQKGKDLLKNL